MKKELIKRIEALPAKDGKGRPFVDKKIVIGLIQTMDEPKQPTLNNIIHRIKFMEEDLKQEWLSKILKELGSDFGSKMFHEAYQQGRFDEGIEARYGREKVKVSEEEAKFLETFDFNRENDVATALYHVSRTGWGYHLMDNDGTELKHLSEGLRELGNRKRLIKAILGGYEVEKEPKYIVKLKGVYHGDLGYAENFNGYSFYNKDRNPSGIKYEHTRKGLEEAGFGWVFDCPGIKVREVEE